MITFILLNSLIFFWLVFVVINCRQITAWLQGITAGFVIFVVAYSPLLWHEYEVSDNAYIYGECLYRVVVLDDPVRGLFTSQERTSEYLHKMAVDHSNNNYEPMRCIHHYAPLGYFIKITRNCMLDGPYLLRDRIRQEIREEILQEENNINDDQDDELDD